MGRQALIPGPFRLPGRSGLRFFLRFLLRLLFGGLSAALRFSGGASCSRTGSGLGAELLGVSGSLLSVA